MTLKIWYQTLFLAKLSVMCSHVRPRPCPSTRLGEPMPNVIKIGVLLPFKGDHQWVVQATFPAIQLATETVQNSTTILPGYTLVLNLADSQCSETMGPLVAIDMYISQSAHVFIGPACEYAIAPVARFSYYWGIPVLTAGAMVAAFRDKNEYKLLTRVQGPLSKGSEFMLDLFTMFQWQHTAIIYSDKKGPNSGKRNCYFAAEAVFHTYKAKYNRRPYYVDYDEDMAVDFYKILKDCSLMARSKSGE